MPEPRIIELWADSFHEGDWACTQLGLVLAEKGGTVEKRYDLGFIPTYVFSHPDWTLQVVVYGSYKSWSPVPEKIEELLAWGKPDFVAYDPVGEKILFAVEETAAIPTGNQALQRCERMYGSARQEIPFWYLLSEFGVHKDGGVRRDSIWPTIMALKLSQSKGTPCVVLHYSDAENPENYSAGAGLRSLFVGLLKLIENEMTGRPRFDGMTEILTDQYQEMLEFVGSQWASIIDFLPGVESLTAAELAGNYAALATKAAVPVEMAAHENFLVWPRVGLLPPPVREKQACKPLIKHDPLCALFEDAVGKGKAYCLSDNAGSRPQPEESILTWLKQQRELYEAGPELKDKSEFSMAIEDFPLSNPGFRHLTTAKNIVYLFDHWKDLFETVSTAYPRLRDKLPAQDGDIPVLVYVTNSIKPGRLFGDPYTGQIAAFASAFGKLDPRPRMVVAYFPHQAHNQAVREAEDRSNKGLTLMSELTDLLIFHGGIGVTLATRKVY